MRYSKSKTHKNVDQKIEMIQIRTQPIVILLDFKVTIQRVI